MKKLIEAKKMNIALLMLIALTSLITFNACKEDVVEPKNSIIEEEQGDPNVNLQDLLGDAPLCTFRFYTKVDAYTMPIGPYTEEDINNKKIFHGFTFGALKKDWHDYIPKYLTINGMNWPKVENHNYYESYRYGGPDYIEDLNVVMEYEGTEFQWSEKNMPEIDFDFHWRDTIEIDRSKPFYVKYSGGNSGANTTKLYFHGSAKGIYNKLLVDDNENIVVSPEVLQQFPEGLVYITIGIGRHKETILQHSEREVTMIIDNIQSSGFMAKFK